MRASYAMQVWMAKERYEGIADRRDGESGAR